MPGAAPVNAVPRGLTMANDTRPDASTVDAGVPDAAATGRARSPWLILAVLCLGFFMILLDTTIVNIAAPALTT